MDRGTVKWFSPQIGAGFIRAEDGRDIFFRFSNVLNDMQEPLYRGQPVIFNISKNPKGASLSATSVKICGDRP